MDIIAKENTTTSGIPLEALATMAPRELKTLGANEVQLEENWHGEGCVVKRGNEGQVFRFANARVYARNVPYRSRDYNGDWGENETTGSNDFVVGQSPKDRTWWVLEKGRGYSVGTNNKDGDYDRGYSSQRIYGGFKTLQETKDYLEVRANGYGIGRSYYHMETPTEAYQKLGLPEISKNNRSGARQRIESTEYKQYIGNFHEAPFHGGQDVEDYLSKITLKERFMGVGKEADDLLEAARQPAHAEITEIKGRGGGSTGVGFWKVAGWGYKT